MKKAEKAAKKYNLYESLILQCPLCQTGRPLWMIKEKKRFAFGKITFFVQ